MLDAPFVSQAPFGQWDDDRFQDGCEETSSLIAYAWATGFNLTPQSAQDQIIALAQYQQDNFGTYIDTSAQDTADRILRGYFQYTQIEVVSPASWQDLVQILLNNQLIVAPMDGQTLNNPNFTSPGPPRHMLVISGYDADTGEFITQDPGTRLGRNFRYSRENLWQSLRDYPSGDHQPIQSHSRNIIAVSASAN